MVGKGKILISEPYLGDPNFERTVILICEDTKEGSGGFVLNKPSNLLVNGVIKELDTFSQTIFIGGPVAPDSLHFLYKGKPVVKDSLEIAEGIFWGGDYEHFIELANLKLLVPEDFKFFLGYSGWEEGQLESEISEKVWITRNFELDMFTMKAEIMWKDILKSMGGKYKMYSNFPIDPKLN